MNNTEKYLLLVSILGISLLFLISYFIQVKEAKNYSELKVGEFVKTEGRIVSIKSFDDFSIVNLNNNISFTCNCYLEKNQTVIVEGKVTEYKREKQIQANKITIKDINA
jgi:hypothetical protein